MSSTKSSGTYYRRRAMEHYKKNGYQVVLTEFTYPVVIGRQVKFWRTFDLLGADFIAWNTEEFILVQVKSVSKREYLARAKSEAKSGFAAKDLPPAVRKQISMWLPREDPITIEL